MNLQPLRDKILVRPEKRTLSDTLYIQSAEADSRGVVVAVGPEAEAEGLNVGDRITFGTFAKQYKDEYLKFEEIKHNEERLLKMSWQDVCFVMEEENE
jgi:co-chaperonin GroES (HSP10)